MRHIDYYRRTEKQLYTHMDKIKACNAIGLQLYELECIGDLHVQDYRAKFGGSGDGDQVANYVHMKQVLERKLSYLKEDIEQVNFACDRIAALNTEHSRQILTLLNAIYFNPNPELIREGLKLSEHEVKSLRHEAVRLVGRYIYRWKRRRLRRELRKVKVLGEKEAACGAATPRFQLDTEKNSN